MITVQRTKNNTSMFPDLDDKIKSLPVGGDGVLYPCSIPEYVKLNRRIKSIARTSLYRYKERMKFHTEPDNEGIKIFRDL